MTILDDIRLLQEFITFKLLPLVILLGIMIALCYVKRKFKREDITPLKRASKNIAKGIIFGKEGSKVIYSPSDSEGHVAVIGGSGLGKTSAILIPVLRNWQGTSFTIDISGDIMKNVDMPNKMVYEPANPQSIPYNIFGAVDCLQNEDDKNEALEELAFLLMPDDEKAADAARFFNTEGRKILTASLIAFYHAGMDFIDICELIVGSSWKDLFNAIDATEYEKAIRYINSFQGASEQNTAGCKQSADSVLKLFATNERIKKSICRPLANEQAFTPSQLETYNVFVVIEDSKLKLYAPLLHIIVSQSLEYFSNRSNDSTTTILFCLDEFASFGRMEITDALRKLRKKHVRIMILTQSMADIDLIYGKEERMAMMNNFRFKVVLGASDTETQEYFAKLIGYKDTTRHSVSSSANTTTYTDAESKEWAIEPSELDRLGDELILLYPKGYMRLEKNFYFK